MMSEFRRFPILKARCIKATKLLSVLISILFLLCFQFSYGQVPNLKFEHIGSEDGLPQSTIHGIAKDKYGFMWFGTWAGLCRYDGYSFKVYRFDASNKRSINNNRIHNIIRDSNKDLWILTFETGEICRYNYESDDFDRVQVSKVSKKFLKLLKRWNHYKSVNFSYHQYNWSLEFQENALVQQNMLTGEKRYYNSNPSNRWSLSERYVFDIYKDNHNIFWVGTFSNGINKANLNAKPFEYFYHDPCNPKTIIDNNVRAICEDHQGNLWVGTWDRGITIIEKGKYRHIRFPVTDNSNLTYNQIKTLFCDSRGIVWIGTKAGLVNFDPATNKFRYFDQFTYIGINKEIIHAAVYGISEDADHNIWIGSTYLGVFKYVASKNELIHYKSENILKADHAKVIIQDKKKQIWIGTEGAGISILQPIGDSVKLVRFLQSDKSMSSSTISDNRINCLYEDRDGVIWIGTGSGLDRYDSRNNKFIHFSKESALGNVTVAGIIEDENGALWISHKQGVTKINRKTLATRNYTVKDGLQGNEFSDGAAFKSTFSKKIYFGGNNGFNAFYPDSIIPEKTLPATVLTELEILSHRVIIDKEVNGRVVLSRPLHLTKEITLNYDDKTFALEFAGLHFSNPKANKYAYMLEGFDKEWIYTDASRRIAGYSNLEAGRYTFKVKSSNADGVWNNVPATLDIVIKPPFWETGWAYTFYTIIIILSAYLYHRYSSRLARLKSELAYETLIHEKETELHQNKVQFFTNISHEIKTPLTLILAPLERLMNSFSDNRGVYAQLLTMKLSSDRLLKLVNQLLDFRRLETGNVALNLKKHDIVALLKRILESFRDASAEKNIALKFKYDVDSCSFLYDEDKLEKVLVNLMANALKFTPVEGWIKLKFTFGNNGEQQYAVVEVINTGQGISEEEKDIIFLPFKQGKSNTSGGTGLGLAYSRGLVELHGGTLTVESYKVKEEVSETCFKVELPLKRDGNQEAEEMEIIEAKEISMIDPAPALKSDLLNEPKVVIGDRQAVILVVEDNVELRTYLKTYFENYYKVLDAANGREGLDIAFDVLPDIIISDVMMDEMDGLEFCRIIKTDMRTAHIPVILLTAKTPVEDELEGIETGADDYITKPFNLSVLTAKVKNLVISRNSLKEKYRKEISLQPNDDIPMSGDEKMLKRLLQFIEERLGDSELSVEEICSGVGVSRSQLYKKLRELTGLSLSEVVKEIRLKKAKQLLREDKFTVNEIAYMVGFSDSDYFRKCFKAEFSMTPTEYVKRSQS